MSEQQKGSGGSKPPNGKPKPKHTTAPHSGDDDWRSVKIVGVVVGILALLALAFFGGGWLLSDDNTSSSTPATQTETPKVVGNASLDFTGVDLSKCPGQTKHYFANDVTDGSNSMGLPVQVPLSNDGAEQARSQFLQTLVCDPSAMAQAATAYNLLGTEMDFDSNAAQQLAVQYDSNQNAWQQGFSSFTSEVTGFSLADGGSSNYQSVGQYKDPSGKLPTFTVWSQEQGLGPVLVVHTKKGDLNFRLHCHFQIAKKTLRLPPTETVPPPPPSCEQTGTCGPPPCTENCGPPPCTENCGPPPCTENCGPPPCTENCSPPCPPGTTPNQNGVCVQPKDPVVDPYPQGNAPQGGGPNDQSGPGNYRPPESMPQPPSTPRVNPPAPVVTGPSAPTHVTTPVTAPPPEPGVNGTGTGAGSATVTHPDGSTAKVNTGTVAPPK